MELKYKLLEHPFYQAWTHGTITAEQLSKYQKSYKEFIELMPTYWTKIQNSFVEASDMVAPIIDEEQAHIDLWNHWATNLPEVSEFPRMVEVIDSLNLMNPSELLGAIQAFEIQQPGVAQTKKDGLMCHYGCSEQVLTYFDEHINEENHINVGSLIKEKYANSEDYKRGFDKGSELFYNGLNLFLN